VHLFLLQECSITEAKVIKARPYLYLERGRGQQHGSKSLVNPGS